MAGRCGCNTACFCCFRISVAAGYVLCSLWLLFNGVSFPVMSFLFWPRNYIFCGSCAICFVNFIFVSIALTNMSCKIHKLFNVVVYGVCAAYLLGGLMIIVGINVDLAGNVELLMTSLRSKFHVSIQPGTASRMIQTIQIMYYSYLFASYVYCGFILQLYEISNDKRYRK